MMKKWFGMLAAGLLLLVNGKGQAQQTAPLPSSSLGTLSNLKLTEEVQTDEVRWGRGFYRGYGYGGYRYGYGYGYRPYYSYGYRPYYSSYGYGGGYCSPYSYSYAPYSYSYSPYSYGYRPYYNYGYRPYSYGYRSPYYGGYRRIDQVGTPPAATNLAAAPRQVAKVSGPIQLTQFAPAQYQRTPNGMSVTVPPDQENRSYPYNGGPKTIVPLPNGGNFQNFLPAPGAEPERPMVPREGSPVSLPREMSGEVFPVVYGSPASVSTPVSASPSFSTTARIAYPAYGDNR
jgi:hypothetical protein